MPSGSRLLLLPIVMLLWLALPLAAQDDGRVVEVIELRGALDARILEFVADAIEDAARSGDVEVVVLQIDSPGVISGATELIRLLELLDWPPIPIAAWVGPAPAVAYGGALQIAAAAPLSAVAPGSEIGYAAPTLADGSVTAPMIEVPGALVDSVVDVASDTRIPGVVDLVQPSLRQFIILDLDGSTLPAGAGTRVLSTVTPYTADDGSTGVTNLPTVIRQPSLWDQLLRLATRPETAFFLLVAGLTVAAFEFYAIGPGIAAGVAALSLGLSSYGIAVLPVRGWALALAVGSVWLMSVSYQRGGVLAFTGLGVLGLGMSGVWFTDAAPQITPAFPGVLLTVAAAAFFFVLAMPTVARARFSTQTIGRQGLIGRVGTALTAVQPEGEVEVDGARWRASAHRESGIETGDAVLVTGVDGWYLEVEPAGSEEFAKTEFD